MKPAGIAAIVAFILFGAKPAAGQTPSVVWTNTTGNGLWSDPGNWNPVGVPNSSDYVLFSSAGNSDCAIDAHVHVDIFFVDATYAYTITLGSGRLLKAQTLYVLGSTFQADAGKIEVETFFFSGGVFFAPHGELIVLKEFIGGGAYFHPNNGTVVLGGQSIMINGSPSVTFYNLTKQSADAANIQVWENSIVTVAATLTLKGAPGSLLSLKSTVPGSQWRIDAQGDRIVDFVDVMDSKNEGVAPIQVNVATSVDSGNNTGWAFIVVPDDDEKKCGSIGLDLMLPLLLIYGLRLRRRTGP